MSESGERVIGEQPSDDKLGALMKPRRQSQTFQVMQMNGVWGRRQQHSDRKRGNAQSGGNSGHSIGDGEHGGELRGVDLEMRRDGSLQIHILPKPRQLLRLRLRRGGRKSGADARGESSENDSRPRCSIQRS